MMDLLSDDITLTTIFWYLSIWCYDSSDGRPKIPTIDNHPYTCRTVCSWNLKGNLVTSQSENST